MDLVIAGLLLVISAPLLGLAALAIKLESRGPVFYRQRRVGRDGRPFDLWKLRTMVPGAESMGHGIYVVEGDPRITRVGRRLRRFSLDELPNLINVLSGDLAIVGPQAHRPAAGRPLHRAPAPAARGQAGDHRMGPGQRPHFAALARPHRARRLVRRAPLAAPRPATSSRAPRACWPPATGCTARTCARAGTDLAADPDDLARRRAAVGVLIGQRDHVVAVHPAAARRERGGEAAAPGPHSRGRGACGSGRSPGAAPPA